MTSKDDLGDRMKLLEAVETSRKFDSKLPVYARIDGRGFSKFTKYMQRPFDPLMTRAMIETTRYLVDKTHAAAGYVQSDEISLVWDGSKTNSNHFFDGKVQKSCSVLASMAAARFAIEYFTSFGQWSFDCPHFDCRVIQMPSRIEAANMMLWRWLDCRKNAISMAARHWFSHKELQNQNSREMVQMLAERGINMQDFPVAFTAGTWLQRVTEDRTMTQDELAAIPPRHRPAADTVITRSSIKEVEMPDFLEVKNREAVIFENAAPIT